MSRAQVDEQHVAATDAEIAEVNAALLNGDSLPEGFTFNPHGANHPVKKLKNADAAPVPATGEGA